MAKLSLLYPLGESAGVLAIRRFLEEELGELRIRCGKMQRIDEPQVDLVATALLRGEIAFASRLLDKLKEKKYSDDE